MFYKYKNKEDLSEVNFHLGLFMLKMKGLLSLKNRFFVQNL